MLVRKCIVPVVFIYIINSVYCNECVSYDFEEGFEYLFNDNMGACSAALQFWEERQYALSPVEAPDDLSNTYISPLASVSCVSSFIFTMSAGGVVEFNLYMSGDSPMDQLTLLAYQLVPDGNDAVLGDIFLNPADPNFVSGWQSLRMSLIGYGTFQGYISLMGMVAEDSIVLVDSFRYIPPGATDDDCPIYKEESLETTTSTATTVTETVNDESNETDPDPVTSTTETNEDPTGSPDTGPCYNFWTALTISMVVVLGVLALIVVALISYYIGFNRKVGKDKELLDVESLPSTITVPRVKQAYTHTNLSHQIEQSLRLD